MTIEAQITLVLVGILILIIVILIILHLTIKRGPKDAWKKRIEEQNENWNFLDWKSL